MALLLSGSVFYFGTSLLEAHSRICSFVLEHIGIPLSGERVLEVFPSLGPVMVPDTPFPHNRAIPIRTGLLLAASLAGLIIIHRRFPLARNFLAFLMVLICAAAAVILVNPSFYFDAAMFQQIWLRGEILVWIILPWVSAFLFVLALPTVAGGLGWSLLLQIYVAVWSALRLVFCLGVLHYTGILFLPVLWFCLGILFDLVIILFFYSQALDRSIKRVMGARKS